MSSSMASRTARARTSLRLIPVMTVSGSIMEVATRRHTRGAPEQKLDGAPCRAQAGWNGQSMKASPGGLRRCSRGDFGTLTWAIAHTGDCLGERR
jgi:hypothetical protein